jgi:hypothetical protein
MSDTRTEFGAGGRLPNTPNKAASRAFEPVDGERPISPNLGEEPGPLARGAS